MVNVGFGLVGKVDGGSGRIGIISGGVGVFEGDSGRMEIVDGGSEDEVIVGVGIIDIGSAILFR